MSNQLQITGGAKVRNLEGVITGTSGVLGALPINTASGIPQLDSNGKILVSQLPNSVMEFLGVWNASTNTPYLHDGTGNAGDVYLCNVAGTVNFGSGPITFSVGDYVVYTGSVWARSSGATGTVTSVAVSESSAALSITGSPITTSGTINIGFAGTSAQYVAGDGSLITFPALTGYVPYTGATADLNLGLHDLKTAKLWLYDQVEDGYASISYADEALNFQNSDGETVFYVEPTFAQFHKTATIQSNFWTSLLTTTRDHYLPDASGTLALTSDLSAYVPTSRTISTTSPLQGGGDLSANRTLSILQSSSTQSGYLSSTDWNTFNNKETSLSFYSPLRRSGSSITIDQSNSTTNGYLSSTDWNTFNGKQGTITLTTTGSSGASTFVSNTLNVPTYTLAGLGGQPQLNGTGFVKASGTTISYDNSTYLTTSAAASTYLPLTGGTLSGTLNGTNGNFSQGISVTGDINIPIGIKDNTIGLTGTTGYTTIGGNSTSFSFLNYAKGAKFIYGSSSVVNYTLPSSNGTLALTSDIPSLSGYVQGTGTTNYLPKFTGTSTIGNSAITDDGTTVSLLSRALSGVSALFTNATSGDYLTLRNSNPSIGGGEAISFVMDYTQSASSTGWKILSRYAGGNLQFVPNYQNAGYNTPALSLNYNGAATFSSSVTANGIIRANASASGQLVIQAVASDGNASIYLRPNNSGYNLISSNYLTTSPYLPLSLSGRENNTDLVLTTSGNVEIGNSAVSNLYKLDVNGTGRFSGGLNVNSTGSEMVNINVVDNSSRQGIRLNNGINSSSGFVLFNSASSTGTTTGGLFIVDQGSTSLVQPAIVVNQSGSGDFLQFKSGATSKLTIASTGAATFSSSVTATQGNGKSFTARSGNAGQYTFISIGRTSDDMAIGVAGASSQFFIGSVSGDTWVGATNGTIGFGNDTTGIATMVVKGGNVLIGTTTDSGYKLSVNGTSQMGALNLGSLGTGTVYSSSGTLTNTNPSDRRLKQNITPITYGLNEVLQLNPVSFDWKNDNNKNKQFGFIAQEVQNVMPEAVIQGEYLGLEKDAIYTALVNAIKELKQEIETLKIK